VRAAGGLGPEHRRWLALNALAVSALLNAVLCAGIAWASSVGAEPIPLLALPFLHGPSTLTDTLGTLFILPFVTTLLVTAAVRRDQRLDRLPALVLLRSGSGARWLDRLPRRPLRRAAELGAGCLVVLGPPLACLLVVADFGGITQATFVAYKAIFGVAFGLVVTPVAALAAMTDPQAPDPEPDHVGTAVKSS
jgi:hypothetical protein